MKNVNQSELDRLLKGNQQYLLNKGIGDTSKEVREDTAKNGQHPYAVIVTCSDSRVIPEAIFNAGIGELFVIRVAGNVIGEHELGSILYATEHLKCSLIVILGHTQCGAVEAALHGEGGRYIDSLVNPIRLAIGDEKDPCKASVLNALKGKEIVKENVSQDIQVEAMLYDILSGKVNIL